MVNATNSSTRRSSQRLVRKRKYDGDGVSISSSGEESSKNQDYEDPNVMEDIVIETPGRRTSNRIRKRKFDPDVIGGTSSGEEINRNSDFDNVNLPATDSTSNHDHKLENIDNNQQQLVGNNEGDNNKEEEINDDNNKEHPNNIIQEGDLHEEGIHLIGEDKYEIGEHEQHNDSLVVNETNDNVLHTDDGHYLEEHDVVRMYSPGGTTEYIQLADGEIPDGEAVYVDENGRIIGNVPPEELHEFDNAVQPPPPRSAMIATTGNGNGEPREVEFSFFDQKNVCCGMCGEVVPFDSLMNQHLPERHPEIMNSNGSVDFEEVPYSEWLKDKLHKQKASIDGNIRSSVGTSESYIGLPGPATQRNPPYAPPRTNGERVLRKVSQVRVNPTEMTIPQLENALRKKMVEKMGRKVPVTLVDKQHAQCGICQAIVSLNKKFEIVHLVRHFNAWHPSVHRCSGSWPGLKGNTPQNNQQAGVPKPLSCVDFAIVDSNINANDNLQCIWCGMFMDTQALAMHFYEVHPSEVEVPRCHLCLLELVVNARLSEKFGTDFQITLPDEHHFYCGKFGTKYSKEKDLEKGIVAKLKKIETGKEEEPPEHDDEEEKPDHEGIVSSNNKIAPVPENFSNSRMSLGRRSKPKRHFVQPALRQAAPKDSQFIEVVSLCHWKCKLCGDGIMAAVISAGAIRHFRSKHPEILDAVQVELCKARLEKVSDGCMEFINPTCIECRVCQMSYPLHKPYNMCRAIRHLKAKHPQYMPEYSTDNDPNKGPTEDGNTAIIDDSCFNNETIFNDSQQNTTATSEGLGGQDLKVGDLITDPTVLAELREKYVGVDFDKVQQVINSNGETFYILMTNDQELDESTIQHIAANQSGGVRDA
uniref:C2H2-type domain-containing protein n=1 Tax=Parastrongyloides trichosuri TaxID=131310 RepID=A0A0N4ZPV4_PARTI